jgi:hypothetical protein
MVTPMNDTLKIRKGKHGKKSHAKILANCLLAMKAVFAEYARLAGITPDELPRC